MNQEQWERLQHLFRQAKALAEPARNTLVKSIAGQDPEMAAQLQRMLLAPADRADHLLDRALEDFSGDDEPESLDQLGPYRLLKAIGTGGMGRVYLAQRSDGAFDREMALKVVKRGMDSDQVLTRFRREQQILARLEHPNIAQLLDAGVSDSGRLYFVMEYVDGQPIHQYCDDQRLSIDQRLALFGQVCGAVQHAHHALIVHRDLKPSNILVSSRGQVKLLDFGIAKLLGAPDGDPLTRTGEAVLTPDYAAPEQIKQQPITTAVDVYALGVLLFELLSGTRPFETEADNDLRERQLNTDPLPPSRVISRALSGRSQEIDTQLLETSRQLTAKQLERRLKGDLDNICLKALQRDPGHRYRSVDQLNEDIGRYQKGLPINARPHSLGYRTGRFLKRHAFGSAATLAVLIALASLVVFYTQRVAQERDSAVAEQQKTQEVVDFVTGMFARADPANAMGEAVTVGTVLDTAVTELDTTLLDRPAVRGRLLAMLGELKYALGRADQAESILREALSAQLTAHGENHLDTATIKLLLAFVHQNRGELAAAGTLLNESEAIRRLLLPAADPEMVEIVSAQAELKEFEGNYGAAEALYLDALKRARLSQPPSSSHVASMATKLAGLLRTVGRNTEAEPLLDEALTIFAQIYPDGHPDVSSAQRQLAGLMRDTGRFDEAKPLYEQLIRDRERMLGPTHLEVANSYNSYSQLLDDMGETEAAMQAQQKMIDLVREHQGDPHPSLAAAYNNMAFLKRNLDDLEGAVHFFERSAQQQEQLGLDPNHINRSFPMGGKAVALIDMDRFSEAEPLLREALRIRELALPAQHRRVLELRLDLGKVLTALGQFEEAEAILEAVFTELEGNTEQIDKRQNAARHLVTLYKAMDIPRQSEFYSRFLDSN